MANRDVSEWKFRDTLLKRIHVSRVERLRSGQWWPCPPYEDCVSSKQCYSSGMPAAAHASCIESGQMPTLTSPTWAVRRKNMHIRDCPIPPPMD